MNHEALEKMWRKSQGRVPHLDEALLKTLVDAAVQIPRSEARFWGVVDTIHRVKEMSVLHCFNFGNMTVHLPWQAEAVNCGLRLPMIVSQTGNIRLKPTFRTMLHQMETPFLVFRVESDSMIEERLANGFLVTEPGTTEMVSVRTVALVPGSQLPETGILFYYLMKRVAFTAQALGTEAAERGPATLAAWPRVRLQLNTPMALEPGWVVHLLEGDRWLWGVVVE